MIIITISFLNGVLRPRVLFYTPENYFASQVGKMSSHTTSIRASDLLLNRADALWCSSHPQRHMHDICPTCFFCTPYDILRLRAYWSSVCCQEVPASWANVMFYCDESYIIPQWLAHLPRKQKVPSSSQFPSI